MEKVYQPLVLVEVKVLQEEKDSIQIQMKNI